MAALDTHKAFRTLTGAGFPDGQAEALVETIGIGSDELATKADIADMATKADIANIREEMATKTELAAVRAEMATKADIAAIREEIATKAELAAVRAEMATKPDIAAVREEMTTKTDFAEFRAEFKDLEVRLERRLTNQMFQMAFLVVMLGGFIVALLKLLP